MGGPDQIAAVSVKIRSDGCTLLNAALFHGYSGTRYVETSIRGVYTHRHIHAYIYEENFRIILSFLFLRFFHGFLAMNGNLWHLSIRVIW